jgi:hypothetical protein
VYAQEKALGLRLEERWLSMTLAIDHATWVKVNGQWLYKIRQITSGTNPPEG